MNTSFPPRDALKSQAKRLRSDLNARGHALSHAQALELIAQQWGARDWNTLSAALKDPESWYPGQQVTGRYLGHRFTGRLKAARAQVHGFWQLVVRFDQPVDVVTSDKFSAFRRQVTATIGPDGRTRQKTSDGVPHMVLDQGAAPPTARGASS